MTNLRFVWTRKAVERFLNNGTFDPRHTNSNLDLDIGSPWLFEDMGRRANGSPWVLVDGDGSVCASSWSLTLKEKT